MGALIQCLEAAPLTRVHRTRLILDDTPWIAELVASEQGTRPILTVVIDRAHARFFEVTAMGRTELAYLTAASTRGGKFHSDRGDAPGWGERDYHRRLEQERHRHYANVVRRVEDRAWPWLKRTAGRSWGPSSRRWRMQWAADGP